MSNVMLLAIVFAASCGDNEVSLLSAYRETAMITCELEATCQPQIYYREYRTREQCVHTLSHASLGTRDPSAPANVEMLDLCLDRLSTWTCSELELASTWPGACVAIPR